MQKCDEKRRCEPTFALCSAKVRKQGFLEIRGELGPHKLQTEGTKKCGHPLPERCYADPPSTDEEVIGGSAGPMSSLRAESGDRVFTMRIPHSLAFA